MEINRFTQQNDESLYDAWIQFNINQNPNYPNPNENVNAITTRSGLTTQGIEDPHPQPFITQEPLPSFIEEEIEVSKEKGKEKVNSTEGTDNDETGKKKGNEPLKATRPVSYPKALRKDKLAAQYKKFQDMMKNVSVNLPITEVLKGMPNYGRFIKELISQRAKYHDETSFFIEEECNKILASRLRIPKKLGDLGKFIFLCKFGGSEVFNALFDLGASINLMPHSLYEQLGLGPLKPTRIRIRLANHSFHTTIGITEDILVSIDTLVFSIDFVIMEMKEDLQVPLILGRPFLTTADTIILVQCNQLNIGVGEERVTINIWEAMKQSKADFRELMNVNIDESEIECETTREEPFETIPNEDRFRIKSSWEEPPTLELKELPEHLEYAYLKEANQLPVIISLRLTQDQKTQLVSILKSHHSAIACKNTDIPGINPSYCTHKILMEENFKPVVQKQ
ncbi:uncharacterized protein [Rutidosis leptorrhynchoides]|uniref:uncharacterized protein n=1 Tax=Rutidosis leptorrhynchoides TaxID=125765 RepID=UPI003A98E273